MTVVDLADNEPSAPHIDLGDLCAGLLNGSILAAAPACEQKQSPREVMRMAMPQPIEVPCEASPALGEDDEVDGCPCWGGMLKGTSAQCTPGFASGKAHFKNKFCEECRKGIDVPADRVRAVRPGVQALYANSLRAGFWKRSAPALGGGEVRIANNTITCDGPWLIVYRAGHDVVAPPCATEIPDAWVSRSGTISFSIAKGTLVPMAEMVPKSKAHPSPSEHLVGFNQGPKRQRRAPTLADVPASELPPGGLPPSVRRMCSSSTAASTSVAEGPSFSRSSSVEDSPLGAQPLERIGQQLLPPLMIPSPNGPAVSHSAVGSAGDSAAGLVGGAGGKLTGTSLLASASPPASYSRPAVTAVTAVAARAPLPVATVAATQPSSPAQLVNRLASTYEQAASLLEQALKPLSPMRAQMSADVAAELTAQLNAARLAMQACQRLAAA